MDLNAYLLDSLIDATTPAGETETGAGSRRAAIHAMFHAFEPADAGEAMMASHCVALQFLTNAAIRDASRAALTPEALTRVRAGAMGFSRVLFQWVSKLEKIKQRKAAKERSSAEAAVAANGAPARRPSASVPSDVGPVPRPSASVPSDIGSVPRFPAGAAAGGTSVPRPSASTPTDGPLTPRQAASGLPDPSTPGFSPGNGRGDLEGTTPSTPRRIIAQSSGIDPAERIIPDTMRKGS